ncbi:hypothetical protein [Peteryoungia ipomoeae]|uniref:Uncharacterized protein n=1 Tax=Peteryoungia ipomoeae TaxID=1210932 RepID=A0A4S8P1K5_9HYPH|nr:hypothetical protein [Peteryoungia ipomoeae]THV23808.1 hypothetical protein FAA97_07415 [Peteryoungia ipomoeae]
MMEVLATLFDTGWISAIAVLVLWAVTLTVSQRSHLPWKTLKTLMANAVSGTALLVAFGLALRGAPPFLLASLLAIALVAFLVDLRARLACQASGLRRRTE